MRLAAPNGWGRIVTLSPRSGSDPGFNGHVAEAPRKPKAPGRRAGATPKHAEARLKSGTGLRGQPTTR